MMKNINRKQQNELDKLKSGVPAVEIRWNDEHGVASLLEGNLLPWRQVQKPDMILHAVLEKYGILLGPPDVIDRVKVTEVGQNRKSDGYRVRACQVFDNLPIFGATLLVFANEEHGVYRIQSSFFREVKVTEQIKLDERDLQNLLGERLRKHQDAAVFEETWKRQKPNAWAIEHFPLTGYPTLYLFPVKGGFHPVYNTMAFQSVEWLGVDGLPRNEIGQVELILDAATGEMIWMESTKEGMAYSNQTGDGLSTLKDSNGNYLTRTLHVVRKDSADYYMLNRLQTPDIRTCDAHGSLTVAKLKSDSDLSIDPDNHWNTTTTSCTSNTRRDAQQPEVDGHFNAEEAWNFYHNLGWDGFDDGAYGTHCPVRVAAHIGMDANAYFDKYSEPIPNTTTNKYYGYIAFYDGQCDGTTLKFDFMAGDTIIFGHEYQHAITFFGSAKSNGEPGYLYWNMWCGAIREGYSDAISCLRRGLWINPPFYPDGAIHPPASGTGAYQLTLSDGSVFTVYPRPFRRVEYPRSSNTYDGSSYCDHYDDRDSNKNKYFHSTLLSHLAYLVGQGGVHQRTSRGDAEFIPVNSIGLQRTAEIFHFALTQYFDTIPTTLSGETLIEAARLLMDAAKNVPGSSNRKCEYVMMRRALYALGLYPYDSSYVKQTYGGEACMLPWTYSWRFSQPYLGFPALWWQSPDLFINNNGSAAYNAVVGQENKVFARVRNIGDQDLLNVRVRFYFCPAGTNLPAAIAGWHPCQNMAGVDCVLDIANLAAGTMNFLNVNTPPASQAVLWYLDPAYVTSEVDHFCLRAVIECGASNHDNDCTNEVQSNIQYEKLPEDKTFDFNFQVANWLKKPIPLDLRITHTLPRGFRVEYPGEIPLGRIILQPREPRTIKFRLKSPLRSSSNLIPPYDGKVVAKLSGLVDGKFNGELSGICIDSKLPIEKRRKRNILMTGMIAGEITTGERNASLEGDFRGELDPVTGSILGDVVGNMVTSAGKNFTSSKFRLDGHIDPLRVVHFTQMINGKPVGGITVKIKFPNPGRL